MKYTTSVDINLSRARVIELFDNADNYAAWQESLVSRTCLEGKPGQVGTRTRLEHKMGKREITMIETITRREFSDLFILTYEATGVWNEALNRFAELEDKRTRWTIETQFRCSGIMWLLTTIALGIFKKQTKAAMEAFKTFAENQSS